MTELNEGRIVDVGIRLLFLALFVYVALMIVAPLAGIVLWSVILAVAVYPAFDWLQARLGGRRGLSATLIVLIGLALTIGPLAAAVGTMAEAASSLTDRLQNGTLVIPPPPEGLKEIAVIGPKADQIWTLFNTNLDRALQEYGATILHFGTAVAGMLAGLGVGILGMALSIVVMGVMLSPGPKLGGMLESFGNRVFAPKGGEFVALAALTVRNVTRGVLGVSAIQAFLAGVVMYLFGFDSAWPLALVVLILAIVQVGPAPVILPAIIYAFSDMSTVMAILFTVIMIPVMVMDGVLRPIFIARGLDTPIVVILVGVIGGVLAGGIVGIFIGPVILAVFHELFSAWMKAGDDAPEDDVPQEAAP